MQWWIILLLIKKALCSDARFPSVRPVSPKNTVLENDNGPELYGVLLNFFASFVYKFDNPNFLNVFWSLLPVCHMCYPFSVINIWWSQTSMHNIISLKEKITKN